MKKTIINTLITIGVAGGVAAAGGLLFGLNVAETFRFIASMFGGAAI